jgi:hypothetical protein
LRTICTLALSKQVLKFGSIARLSVGCDWHREIEAKSEAARVVLPLLTPRWKQSQWTRYETYSHDQIVPLVFERDFLAHDASGATDEVASVSTPPLRRFQAVAIDFRTATEGGWPKLVEALKVVLSQSPREPRAHLTRMRYDHADFFVGREGKLDEIHEKLWINPIATLTQGQVQAVIALGGVGKAHRR